MTELEELRALAEMADKRGDKETALAAMRKMEALSSQKQVPLPAMDRALTSVNPAELDDISATEQPVLKGIVEGAKSLVPGGRLIGEQAPGMAQSLLTTGQGLRQLYLDATGDSSGFSRAAAAQRAGFAESASPMERIGEYSGNIGQVLSLRTPQALASIPGFGGLAARAAAGSGLAGGISMAIPREQATPISQRLDEAKLPAALGGVASVAVDVLKAVPNFLKVSPDRAKTLRQGQLLEESVFGKGKSPFKIFEREPVISVGRKSGDPVISTLETAAEKSGRKGFTILDKSISRTSKAIGKLADDVDANRISKEEFGRKVNNAWLEVTDNAYKLRTKTSAPFWNKAESLAPKMADGKTEKAFIPSGPIREKLTQWVDEGVDGAKRILNKMKSMGIADDADELTFSQFRSLQKESSAALGSRGVKIFGKDTKIYAPEYADTLAKVIDDASGFLKEGDEFAKALKDARTTWALGSQRISDLSSGTLGKLFKITKGQTIDPSKAANKLFGLSPEEVKTAIGVMRSSGQGSFVKTMQANFLRQIIDKASAGGGSKFAGETKFDPNTAFTTFGKTPAERMAKIRSIFDDPETYKRVTRIFKMLDRLSDKASSGAGAPGVMTQGSQTLRNIVSGNPIFIAGQASNVLTPGLLQALLYTKGGQKFLMSPHLQNRLIGAEAGLANLVSSGLQE